MNHEYMNHEYINNTIKKYFTNFNLVKRNDNEYNVNLLCHENESVSFFINFNYGKNIYVNYLHAPCNTLNGTTILQNIQSIAKELKIKNIYLDDSSKINIYGCSIPLALVSIMINGESWYNKMGFFSDDYKEELDHNINWLTRSTAIVIQEIKDKAVLKNEYDEKLFDEIDKMFEGNLNIDFNIAFMKIYNKIRFENENNKTCNKNLKTLIYFIEIIDKINVIEYNSIGLTYYVPEKHHKTRSKRRTKRRTKSMRLRMKSRKTVR